MRGVNVGRDIRGGTAATAVLFVEVSASAAGRWDLSSGGTRREEEVLDDI